MTSDLSTPGTISRGPIFARNVVATSQPLAAQAGLSMLSRGGNAVDAALAAAIALTVVEPTGNGLGSDAFAMVWDGGRLQGLNASGASPAGWTPERFSGHATMPLRGWESVTTPGAVSAWVALSERYGKLAFADLFGPAIAYARHGFPLSPIIGRLWALGARELADQPGFAEHFMAGGRTPEPGDTVRFPVLADTLEQIAGTRGEAFYRGQLAERIVSAGKSHDAALSLDDLASHSVEWVDPISVRFRDIELCELPPNGQGIAALMALGILDHTAIDRLDGDSPEALHLQIEAIKLAFADAERYVSDPKTMSVPPHALLAGDYLAGRAALIDPARAQDFEAGAPGTGGTVYLAAGDADGMMVSFIQSNFAGFGSGVVVPGTGIHLQNRGAGFTLEPGHPNRVAPRKRPFHTIIPGFLMRGGEPVMSFGVMGGPMQAQGHVQMVLRTQVFGQNPQAAIDAPRWRVVSGLELAVESTMPKPVVEGLAALGHCIRLEAVDTAFGFGGAQIVQRLGDGYVAGSDPRKDGQAVGF